MGEEERQRKLEEERKKRLHQPRDCKICHGSGNCVMCKGAGCSATLYLAPTVNATSAKAYGRLPLGCKTCGGSGDGGTWGEFVTGSGKCFACLGAGQVKAPPNGWPVSELAD